MIRVSLEQLIEWNPDIIILSAYSKHSPSQIISHPQFKILRAVKEKQVYKKIWRKIWKKSKT